MAACLDPLPTGGTAVYGGSIAGAVLDADGDGTGSTTESDPPPLPTPTPTPVATPFNWNVTTAISTPIAAPTGTAASCWGR